MPSEFVHLSSSLTVASPAVGINPTDALADPVGTTTEVDVGTPDKTKSSVEVDIGLVLVSDPPPSSEGNDSPNKVWFIGVTDIVT